MSDDSCSWFLISFFWGCKYDLVIRNKCFFGFLFSRKEGGRQGIRKWKGNMEGNRVLLGFRIQSFNCYFGDLGVEISNREENEIFVYLVGYFSILYLKNFGLIVVLGMLLLFFFYLF